MNKVSSSAGASSVELVESEVHDDDSISNSSTSTAGPPPGSPHNTGRFSRPSWRLALAQAGPNSQGTSPASSCRTRSGGRQQTGSVRPLSVSGHTGSYRARSALGKSFNSVSTSASPISNAANREWGRSFRLFSTSRYLTSAPGLRHLESSVNCSTMLFKTPLLHNMNARGSTGSGDNDRTGLGTLAGLGEQRTHGAGASPVINNAVYGNAAYTPTLGHADHRGTSVFFLGGSQLAYPHNAQSCSGSPVLSPQNHFLLAPNSSMLTPRPSMRASSVSFVTLAGIAMGGDQTVGHSSFQAHKELPMLFNSLRSFLALNGKTISVGDAQHPLEIKQGARIGTGGFAEVYAGLNTVRGDLVAIKEISIEDVNDIKALNAIEQEFALLKSIRHPNVVTYHLFEHSKSKKVCRIVMELLAGGSTLSLLHRYGPLTESSLRILARHLLSAIACIHREGIFHSDIKPANILVTHRGEVKLCDFGCSKRVSELNKATSCIIGTPVYMAPEFIKGEANHKADIWSVGCSLFELALGLLPWYHSGVKDHLPLMFYITTTSESPLVIPIQENTSDFSPDFVSFMELCFTRDPERRPEAEELLKHPWITGVRNGLGSPQLSNHFWNPRSEVCPPIQHASVLRSSSQGPSPLSTPLCSAAAVDSFSSDDAIQSPAATTMSHCINDEAVCQRELEEVAALIAADLCRTLTNTLPDCANRNVSGRLAEMLSETTNDFSVQSLGAGGYHCNSGSVVDLASGSTSLAHSIAHDTLTHNPFTLGAQLGYFMLPSDASEATQQQYMRINDDGRLDFATFFDMEQDGLREGMRRTSCSPDSSGVVTGVNSRVVSPAHNNSFSRGSMSPANHASVVFHDRHGSSPHNPVRYSRTASPSSGATLPLTTSMTLPEAPHAPRFPTTTSSLTQQLQQNQQPQQLTLHGQRSFSLRSSSRDEIGASTPWSPMTSFVSQSTMLQQLPEKAKPQSDGKLHVSFAVNTGAGEHLSVELNVDPTDVHCHVVDNQPNYVVALSDDIKVQLAAKMKEVAARSLCSSPVMGQRNSLRDSGNSMKQRVPPMSHFSSSLIRTVQSSRSPARPHSRQSTGSLPQCPSSPAATGGGGVVFPSLSDVGGSHSPSPSSSQIAQPGALQVASILSRRISSRTLNNTPQR